MRDEYRRPGWAHGGMYKAAVGLWVEPKGPGHDIVHVDVDEIVNVLRLGNSPAAKEVVAEHVRKVCSERWPEIPYGVRV